MESKIALQHLNFIIKNLIHNVAHLDTSGIVWCHKTGRLCAQIEKSSETVKVHVHFFPTQPRGTTEKVLVQAFCQHATIAWSQLWPLKLKSCSFGLAMHVEFLSEQKRLFFKTPIFSKAPTASTTQASALLWSRRGHPRTRSKAPC